MNDYQINKEIKQNKRMRKCIFDQLTFLSNFSGHTLSSSQSPPTDNKEVYCKYQQENCSAKRTDDDDHACELKINLI